MRLLPANQRLKWLAITGYVAVAFLAVAAIVIATFPIGLLKPTIEQRLSKRFGRTVTIASIERLDSFSLHPTILIRGLRIPQPAWAGTGDLARIDRAQLRIATLPLLSGRVRPDAIMLSGAHLAFVRARDGRENWHGPKRDTPSRRTPLIERLTIADSTFSYRDAKRDRQFALRVESTRDTGLIARGSGLVRGSPVTIAFTGGPSPRGNRAWPFRATITGADLTMRATGRMASMLDSNHMAVDVTAQASDLRYLDAIIEAGLFATQPVRLSAHVERDAPAWRVTALTGTIGRSAISGHVTVVKRDGRNRIDGAIRSSLFDPSDLSSDAGIAAGVARERSIGKRLVPDTRIDLGKIDRTDGRLDLDIARIVSRSGESAMKTARGTIRLDHQLMTIAPLRIGLAQGAIVGRALIDQRGDRPVPTVMLDLRLTDSSIPAVAGGGGSVIGRLDGRARLVGHGHTIREAVGASSGRIGIAARDGSLPEKIAAALGFDAGRAIFAGKDDRAGLRCVIVGVTVRNGQGRVGPFVLDTTESQLRGAGSISFPSEALAIRLTGAPKRDAVLRLPGSAMMTGSIREPDIVVPKKVKSVGNIFKAIGRAITGKQGPTATDADCAGLAAGVLR